MSRKNPIAKAVRTPQFRVRKVASAKTYRRQPKHKNRSAE